MSPASTDPRVRACAAIGAGALLASCMTAKLDENRIAPMRIAKGEAVVILAKPQVEGTGAEQDFMSCVGDKLAQGGDGLSVYGNEDFQDTMYPWFEPSVAPVRAENVALLLERPKVSRRLGETGVRYIVWLDGNTRKTDGGGSLACGAAPGIAGCIGFGWWEKQSDYQATVWDLKSSKSAGSVSTNVTGTSAILGLMVPLPFVARVQATACDRMAGQLRTFLKGGDPSVADTGSR